MRTMQNAAQFHSYPPASGLTLVELASAGDTQVVGVSAAWRKLLLQAEMAAPHTQVATVEGEQGSGKQTLARYLLRHSPLAGSDFQRRDAREWLLEHGDPAEMAGFTYLDRVDLLGTPGQGLLLSVLKSLQDRPPGRVMLVASSQASLCASWRGRGNCCPTWHFASRRYDLRFLHCACARRTFHQLLKLCWTGFAHATSIGSSGWVRALWPVCCSTGGPAMSANWPACSKPACLRP